MSREDDAREIRIADGDLAVRVSRLGGAVTSAQFRGHEFLVAAGGAKCGAACFPLVPFGNRVDHNAMTVDGRDYRFRPNTADPFYLHGDGWLGLWQVERQGARDVELSFLHEADDLSPYRYKASQTIAISGRELALALSVMNLGQASLPFGLGFHPFFPSTPGTRLEAAAGAFWSERDGHLPGVRCPIPAEMDFATGKAIPEQWINNAFEHWTGEASIVWPEHSLKAAIDADSVFGNYMIYTPGPGSGFFCFEPMSHLPNGHHMPDLGGLTPLKPGETMSGGMRIGLSMLHDTMEE